MIPEMAIPEKLKLLFYWAAKLVYTYVVTRVDWPP